MRLSFGLVLVGVMLGFVAVFALGQALIQPPSALILDAGFADEGITPNADGENDITRFRYSLSRNARVTLRFTSETGDVFTFREDEPRIGGDYTVLFSGVVDGYTLPGEDLPGTVERRLMPNGVYTWELIAEAGQDQNDARETLSGTLTLAEADEDLPIMSIFDLSPTRFTPNQDGRRDRVEINVYVSKADAALRVVLIDEQGIEIPISARREGRDVDEVGQRHIFDYEGGVDLGAEPPPDGTYTVRATAQDPEGQRTSRETSLTIADGGKPRAEIAPQAVGVDVMFDVQPYDPAYFTDDDLQGERIQPPDDPEDRSLTALLVPLGDMLVFGLTVDNYGSTKIRTTGPPPGTVYQQDQLDAALGEFESPGAWRVGLHCETFAVQYPYRWAIGTPEQLETEVDDATGETFYYLPAGESAFVWGAVRFTAIETDLNPQTCYMGLIHERVAISLQNARVGPREVRLVDPADDPTTRDDD